MAVIQIVRLLKKRSKDAIIMKNIILLIAIALVICCIGSLAYAEEAFVTEEYWILKDGYKADFSGGMKIEVSANATLGAISNVFRTDFYQHNKRISTQFRKYDSDGN